MVHASMPSAICSEYSPLSTSAMPHAYSTTSSPRITSPLASVNTLPCSRVMHSASRSWFASIACLKRNITRARESGLAAAQAGNARRATATA
jgi:hypothetical protein